MVVGKSPEWLPPGFTEKVKYKNGRKIKYYFHVATGRKYHSKKDVICCGTEDNGLLGTPQTKNVDENGLSSDNKVDAISVKTNDSAAWLPNGWVMEERTRRSGSNRGSIYKVYTDLSSGSKFYSKAAVTRYLNTVDHANTMNIQNNADKVDGPNVDKPSSDMSPQFVTMANTGGIHKKKRKSSSFVTMDNVDEPNVDGPSSDMSPQLKSMTNTGRIHKKKRKGNSFVTVAIESIRDDDLPSGWIKEIKTSKCGNKIRKDPYYTDPISGYVFRSKLDALRYLKTNDIGSCACRPLKRESDDVKLFENKIPSSSPANEKFSVHKRQLLFGGEVNGGGESSGMKSLAESEAKISKEKQGNYDSVKITSAGADCLQEKISFENSNKNREMENNSEPANDISNEDARVMAVDMAICPTVTDPLTKQELSASGNRTKVDSKKFKKRRDASLPVRSSKRLAGSQPEMPSNLALNERSLRAAVRRSSAGEVDASRSSSLKASASTPLPSDVEPAKEAAERASVGSETHQDIDPVNKVEKPPGDGPAIPEEQSGAKASEKQLDDSKRSQESPLCYDFGDSWSDPLEFAFKTLRGEISFEDTLTFPSCFNEQLSTSPYNQADGCLKQSQSDAPIIFQNDASLSDTSKQHSAVDQLPPNSSSFSTPGNIGFTSFGGFNCQSSAEVGKKDSQTKFNP